MNILAPVHEHVEGEKIGVTTVSVTVPSKYGSTVYNLSPEQAELHRRLWTSPRLITINNITTYLEVIGKLGEYSERALATLDENSLKMLFHVPYTDEDVPAQLIVGEFGASDDIQYYPDTLVGKREKLQSAIPKFKQK